MAACEVAQRTLCIATAWRCCRSALRLLLHLCAAGNIRGPCHVMKHGCTLDTKHGQESCTCHEVASATRDASLGGPHWALHVMARLRDQAMLVAILQAWAPAIGLMVAPK